ncbi:MAG: D-alanyl-D-alanine carboxypeptidase [Clostridia bacterium]|nr:D-alanyl-D-alanine carboxypeptidase [Clostridia bacterium]
MKKKLLICLLTFCFVFLPLTAVAESGDVKALFANGSYPYADLLYENGTIADTARLTVDYVKDEQVPSQNAPEIGCKAAFVADPVSGKVFYEKNAHDKMFPASTTKILTALVVLENCTLDETATVSNRAVSLVPDGYVRANLQPGEQLSVYTLLQALLIPSANDAAYVLAEHVGGSVGAFAALCNERAQELGCESVHFVNPNGIHDADHYCSAYDLFLIARACQKHDVFNEIVTTKSITLPATDRYPNKDRTFKNTNALLSEGSYYVPYCTGIKTGYTEEAGECLVASSAKDDLNLISVVLGGRIIGNTNERFSDTKKLLEFVYDNYAFRQIADKTKPLSEVNVIHAVKGQETLDVLIRTDIYAVAPNGTAPDNIRTQLDLSEEIKAPVKQNQVLGTVTYHADGMVYSTNLVAAHDVRKKPFWLYNLLVAMEILLVVFAVVRIVKKRQQ